MSLRVVVNYVAAANVCIQYSHFRKYLDPSLVVHFTVL